MCVILYELIAPVFCFSSAETREKLRVPCLEFFNRRGRDMKTSQVVPMIPAHWPLTSLQPGLRNMMIANMQEVPRLGIHSDCMTFYILFLFSTSCRGVKK